MAQLLVKAISSLADSERDQVYLWLLNRGLAAPGGAPPHPSRPPRLDDLSAALMMPVPIMGGGSAVAPQAGLQVVPVRFAADQHAQLRTWCAEHGFSMATVIRGLVTRFLEGQLPPGR